MPAPVEIRNSTFGKIFPALGPFLIAAIFGFFALKGLASGAPGQGLFLVAVLALGCLGLGLFLARGAFDTGVQVVLDARGFRNRRGGDVLVPWEKVRSVHPGKGAAMISFELTEPLPMPSNTRRPMRLPACCPSAGTSSIWRSPRSTPQAPT